MAATIEAAAVMAEEGDSCDGKGEKDGQRVASVATAVAATKAAAAKGGSSGKCSCGNIYGEGNKDGDCNRS